MNSSWDEVDINKLILIWGQLPSGGIEPLTLAELKLIYTGKKTQT